MLVSSNFSIAKIEQSNIHLFLKSSSHFFLSKFIKELMSERLCCIKPLLGRIDHDLREEIKQQWICFREYRFPLSLLDFGEFIIIEIVVWIHLSHLSLGWGSKDLDDLDQVINAALPNE
jgi:hypothetical protein